MTDPASYLKDELYELIRKDEKIFEFIQSGSLDGIWYLDLETMTHEWMSPEFKALFGYEEHEIPNDPTWWQENLEPGQIEEVMATFQAHLDDPNSPYDQVVSYRHKDGSTVWVRCRGVAIRDEHGKPLRMLGCHTDVTPLKRAELELTQRLAELEQANHDLQHFASIVSHDLQEPLRKINVFGDMLRSELEPDLDDNSRYYLDHMQKTAARMSLMIRTMAQYTRISYKSVPMFTVDLTSVLDGVRFDLAAILESTEADITVDPLPHVHANDMHMHQLFLNIISNALKFRKPDTPPKIHISYTSPDPHHVTIRVQDNGIGLDQERFGKKIFEPFQRLHTRSEFEGTGIGLATCKKIVQLHEGQLEVESTLGQGAAFIITLPTHRSSAP